MTSNSKTIKSARTFHLRGKRLTTYAEAKVTKKQHTQPCNDCPWRRDSIRLWLGPLDVPGWLDVAHGEGEPGCHTCIGRACAGIAVFRANVCKSIRDPDALHLEANRVTVFSSDTEFEAHHATSNATQSRQAARKTSG